MAFEDSFRLSAHAVITNDDEQILLVKQTYGDRHWGLPGGALEPGETVHEAVVRECQEELGADVSVKYMSGVYFHSAYNSHAFIFRCTLPPATKITLSREHSEYKYFSLDELNSVQRHRVKDCLEFDGYVRSAKF